MIARKTVGWAVLVVGIVAVVFSIFAFCSWGGPDESVGDHAATTEGSAEPGDIERVEDREDQTVETARQKAMREKLVVPKIDRDTYRDGTIPLPEVAEDSEDD